MLRELRRTRGLAANPFKSYPRLIVSIDWLKRPKAMRLLRDLLPPNAHAYPRRFDLLIVDEVHTCAPAGRGRYARDSQRTEALRTIGPHFEHRLFLSATPHNGYTESFTALLELLDPQRFARGVLPRPDSLARILVRRLKSELRAELGPNPDGTPRFARREIVSIEVPYPDDEREAHAKLARYAELRTKHAGSGTARTAAAFVTLLLKKRLFSSPAAFSHTLEVHLRTVARDAAAAAVDPDALQEAFARLEEDVEDEVALTEATEDALAVAARSGDALDAEELDLLRWLSGWSSEAKGRPDAKAERLLDWLEATCTEVDDVGQRWWNDERVIVFTEYRDTQAWLEQLLTARGLGGDRLALLYGGMDADARERIKGEFQHAPDRFPLRILLATDAASEGIDLQRHCHRMVHVEIPFSPTRLEQRNGRIDRHGQPAPEVLIHHFVGEGWEQAPAGSLEADLGFLSLVARKVDTIREDLGSAGPVIADQVEERMLGKRRSLDAAAVDRSAPQGRISKLDRELSKRISDLRQALDASITELHLQPENVERVVRTALGLARQPDLAATTVDRAGDAVRVFTLPRLTGSWARATEGLTHPVTGKTRPVTFDHKVASDHDDVVLAHLGHRLVQQALWLLRAEIWLPEANARLGRVTARVIPDGIIEAPTVIAHGRLVITGGDGRRLHEEVIAGGGLVRQGRFARITTLGQLQAVINAPTLRPASDTDRRAFAREWPKVADGVLSALERRKDDRAESLDSVVAKRADDDVSSITAVLNELQRAIRAELAEATAKIQLQLSLFAVDERNQVERDIEALHRRLDEIPGEIVAEAANVRRRYAEPTARLFPAAVELCIPVSQSEK
jgi:superfamily II DNA/RNA helicase